MSTAMHLYQNYISMNLCSNHIPIPSTALTLKYHPLSLISRHKITQHSPLHHQPGKTRPNSMIIYIPFARILEVKLLMIRMTLPPYRRGLGWVCKKSAQVFGG